MRRLNVIYIACAPEAIEQAAAEQGLDEFTRLKRKINRDVKEIRKVKKPPRYYTRRFVVVVSDIEVTPDLTDIRKQALKDRETILQRHGTSSETAEASYNIRVIIKNVKEDSARMAEILEKEEKKVEFFDEGIIGEEGERGNVSNLLTDNILWFTEGEEAPRRK